MKDLIMTTMNGPSLEDIDATRCVEHWYIQQKGHIKSI
jgi:hypothetical protein